MAYDCAMKYLCLILAMLAGPASAQGDVDRGLDLLQQGSKLLMQGLMDQLQPELRALTEGLGPALLDLQAKIGDLTRYHPPEVLPNGDIILRRKVPLLPVQPGGEIEL